MITTVVCRKNSSTVRTTLKKAHTVLRSTVQYCTAAYTVQRTSTVLQSYCTYL